MKRFDAEAGSLGGPHLIEASAGTGKTYTITTLYLRLLLELELDVSNILVVTFTEAATTELLERIRSRLREELVNIIQGDTRSDILRRCLSLPNGNLTSLRNRMVRALRRFDEASIFTIHGFCKRMLEDHAFESAVPFDVDILTDESELIREIVCDFWANEVCSASPVFTRYLMATNTWPKNLMPLGELGAKGLDIEILPKNFSEGDFESEFIDALSLTRTLWQNERDTIVKILTDTSSLKANIYGPSRLAKWFEQLDIYLSEAYGQTPSLPVIDNKGQISFAISKLSASKLRSSTKKGKITPHHPFFEACETLVEKSSAFPRKLIGLKSQLLEYISKELKTRKQFLAVRSFDDLLVDFDTALQSPDGSPLKESIRHRYRAVLIDEFQDTDPTQYRIFQSLFSIESHCLYLIGDPKQSIYGFRGADIFAYIDAAKAIRENAHTLKTNWRTDPYLIEVINSLFSRVSNPFYLDSIEFVPVEPRPEATNTITTRSGNPYAPFQIRFLKRTPDRLGLRGNAITKAFADEHLPTFVARDIACLLKGEILIEGSPISPSDVAVLTRTNSEADAMQEAIQSAGIPCVLMSAKSVFLSDEAGELIAVLSAMADPGHPGKVKAAQSTFLLGMGGDEILKLEESDLDWDDWILTFRSWQREWHERGLLRMMRSFLSFRRRGEKSTVRSRILEQARGERRLTNIQHLIELCHEAETEHHLGTNGLILWLEGKRQSLPSNSDSSRQRLESDGDAVSIVTIHRSKGLEFPVVYLPYAWEGSLRSRRSEKVLFHNPENGHKLTLDLGSETFQKNLDIATKEEIAENMRLLYVALTRAKHLLITVWGSLHSMEHSSLGFLLHGKTDSAGSMDFAERVRKLSDAELLEDLEKLKKEAAPGTIDIRFLEEGEERQEHAEHKKTIALRERHMTRKIPRPKIVTSFSALLAGKRRSEGEESDRLDFDDAGVSVARDVKTPTNDENEKVPLADFEKGPLAGSCLHKIYEVLDFETLRGNVPTSVVNDTLTAYGFSKEAWTDVVGQSIDDVLDTPLEPQKTDFTLRGIPRENCLRELEFIFPISTGAHNTGKTVTSASIATLLSAHENRIPEAYLKKLASGQAPIFDGFLKGFIDLVFEKDNRYYLIDFKSNYLGDFFPDYERENLSLPMQEHDYYLQYHLYTVALHKYLTLRMGSYDYDRHFGGVFYLFLRGMSPRNHGLTGVFRDRPSRELVEAFSDLFTQNTTRGFDR